MIENFKIMVIGWFYYGWLFMACSVAVTALLNRVFNKLYIPPLVINAVSVILLLIAYKVNMKNMSYALYFNYVPVVIASIVYNISVFIVRKFLGRSDVKY
ncbi:MAG: hypothetical protein Q4D53_05815 [Leptotrichiaceae bacterium]|nr:hypothetical protein [Leptotrichiaceae bacterium]